MAHEAVANSMSLKADIQTQMKEAMRARQKERLATIRLILAAIKQREVDDRIELNDDQILAILDKMVKQRRESIAQFEKATREDLIKIEQAEIAVIQTFLPQPLTDAEIDAIIKQAMAETGASGMADMGKVMALIKPQAQGRADMGPISAKIKAQLA